MSGRLVAYHMYSGLSVRTIWMDGRPHPSKWERHTFEGFSTGRWVGDTLVVRVTHIKAGYLQRNGAAIPVQPREFRLLEYLMRHAGQVVTRTMLLENVWDYHFDPQTNVIDVHMSRLRSKIDKGYSTPLLHTVRGAGYMIREGEF